MVRDIQFDDRDPNPEFNPPTKPEERMAAGDDVTGGDIYDLQEEAKVVGEEAIGGTTPTPDQSIAGNNAESFGLVVDDQIPIDTIEEMDRRDDRRWELNPESSEDYRQHDEDDL